MDSGKWKITYSTPNQCSMMELAQAPTRPPWRPAAASVTLSKEGEGPDPAGSRSKQRSAELTVPPQYMSVTDLIAAIPKRQRMPKPHTLSNSFGLGVEPHAAVIAPTYPSDESFGAAGNVKENRSPGVTPKSVLDISKSEENLASSSAAKSDRQSATRRSQVTSPISSMSNRHSASRRSHLASPASGPRSQPASPRRTLFHRATPASGARSATVSPNRASPPSPASGLSAPQISTQYSTPAFGLISANGRSTAQSNYQSPSSNDTRGRSIRITTSNNQADKNLPSRGTTGGTPRNTLGSARGMSASSLQSGRSFQGNPHFDGSPPSPRSPSSPDYTYLPP